MYFPENPIAPLANDQRRCDLQMAKVQQKLSSYFRTSKSAKIFIRIARSFHPNTIKQNLKAHKVLEQLFVREVLAFIRKDKSD